MSETYFVKQGVGQGRIISAWMFLVMIDSLAHELDDSRNGIVVENIHIPCILLADDTCVISGSNTTLQRLLDIVYNYSRKWRLSYNSTKSAAVIFRTERRRVDLGKYKVSLGEEQLPMER
ncbi:uncharacterized protein [Argopecten irradians]|uniref:uncharacterized protein n=1 Tax=Argopecten irradians TaxID=31199 RepID=UPI0037239CA1